MSFDSVGNITIEILQSLCKEAGRTADSSQPSNAIVTAVVAVVGLLGTLATYFLKKPGVKSAVGLGASAKKKQQLHDAIAGVLAPLEEIKSQLSASSGSDRESTPKKIDIVPVSPQKTVIQVT
jgi:hypothetical protein